MRPSLRQDEQELVKLLSESNWAYVPNDAVPADYYADSSSGGHGIGAEEQLAKVERLRRAYLGHDDLMDLIP
jgi:hypothetical protein